MGREYSDSTASRRGALLVVDSGSIENSVAVGTGAGPPVLRVFGAQRSAESLLREIAAALAAAEVELRALRGLVALRGPGSFTGLRIGLATLLGLHQASGVPVAAVDTFEVLATAAAPGPRVLAAVDALRGEWFTRLFSTAAAAPQPLEPPRLRRPAELASLAPCQVVGRGAPALVAALDRPAGLAAAEPGPLAPLALALVLRRPPVWDAARLATPLYLRPAL